MDVFAARRIKAAAILPIPALEFKAQRASSFGYRSIAKHASSALPSG
jgi:hypothetical protein